MQQLLVLQQDGSFHQILKVRVHAGADPSVLGHPLLRLDVDVVSHLDMQQDRHENLQIEGKFSRSEEEDTDGWMSTSPMSDLVFHKAPRACRATFSNVWSPVSRLSVANSRMKVPTPAVQVTGVSVGLTPFRRFTVPYGIPLAVWNADGQMSSRNIHLKHKPTNTHTHTSSLYQAAAS